MCNSSHEKKINMFAIRKINSNLKQIEQILDVS